MLALDEPTFGQDRARADELLDLLARLNAQGTTVIAVTHDIQLVADDATHVAVMAGGRRIAARPDRGGPRATTRSRRAGLRPPPLARRCARWRRIPTGGLSRLDDLTRGGRAMTVATIDPYAAAHGARGAFLHRLNPLAKSPLRSGDDRAGRSRGTSPRRRCSSRSRYVVILVGARLTRTDALLLCVALPAIVARRSASALGLGRPEPRRPSVVLSRSAATLFLGALVVGLATALRLGALSPSPASAGSPRPAPTSSARSSSSCTCPIGSATRRWPPSGSCRGSGTSWR